MPDEQLQHDLACVSYSSARAGIAARAFHGRPLLMERSALDAILSIAPHMQLDRGRERASSGYFVAEGVGIIPVMGVLMKRGTGIDWLDEWIGIATIDRVQQAVQAAVADPTTSANVLQIDSPGGPANGIFDLAEFIFAQREANTGKPLLAHADEWAFSAGYLLASAADRIVLPQTGSVGSIGVYSIRVDMTQLDAAMGVRWEIIEFGARKADGNPHKAVSDAERDDLQASVDRIGEMFVDMVARNRGIKAAAVRGLEARTFDGERALDVKLADAVASFGDTVMDLATAPAARRGNVAMSKDTEKPEEARGEVIQMADHRAAVDTAKITARKEMAERREAFAVMLGVGNQLHLLNQVCAADDPDVPLAEAMTKLGAKLQAERVAGQAADVSGQRGQHQNDDPTNPGLMAECRRLAGVKG